MHPHGAYEVVWCRSVSRLNIAFAFHWQLQVNVTYSCICKSLYKIPICDLRSLSLLYAVWLVPLPSLRASTWGLLMIPLSLRFWAMIWLILQ